MNKTKLLTSILGASALVASQASASVLFTDDFSSTTSGSGFSDNWSAGTISGGEIDVNATTAFRTLATTIDTVTADFWVVSNLTVTGATSGWGGLSFYNAGTEDLFFGSDGATTTWEFDARSISDQTSTVPNFTGVETLLVAHYTNTAISMWIDPADTSSEAALGTADKAWAGADATNQATWNRLRIGTSQNVKVNDFTAADTLAESLDPVPEPSTTALLGLGGLALILRRRK